MTEDGWLFEKKYKNHKISFIDKITQKRYEFIIADFRKNL